MSSRARFVMALVSAVLITVSLTVPAASQTCYYIPGDCDNDGTPLMITDVIAMIGMYRGSVVPPYECSCPPHGENFTPTADPDGDCSALSLHDVLTEIGAYRGSATASGCIDCPGSDRLLPGSIDQPLVMPLLKTRVVKKATSASQ